MIEKLGQQLIQSLENGNWLLASVMVLLIAAFKFNSIIDFLDRVDSKKINYIREALSFKIIDPPTESLLEDELNRIIFRRVAGISGSRKFREEIVKLLDASNGEIHTHQLTRASQYLSLKDGKLSISLSRLDLLWSAFNWFMAGYLALLGITVMAIMIANSDKGFLFFASYLIVAIALFAFSVFIASEASRYLTGKLISKKIREYAASALAGVEDQ